MLTIFLGIFLISFVSATTYYVSANGTSNKTNAVGPCSDLTKCMSMATHNAATFSAGDIILLSDKGGEYNTSLTIPSSGSSGNLITYDAVPGESPLLNINGSVLLTNAKSFLSINNLSLFSYGSGSISGISISGVSSNIIINNVSITFSNAGYLITSNNNATNITLNKITGANSSSYPIYFYGAVNSNITIKNVVITKGNMLLLRNIENLTIENLSHFNSSSYGTSIQSCSGRIYISNYTDIYSGSYGLVINVSSFSYESIVKNSTVNYSYYAGFYILNSSGISFQSNNLNHLGNSGFYIINSNNTNLTSNHVFNSSSYGFRVIGNSNNMKFNSNVADLGNSGNYFISGSSHDITFTSDISRNAIGSGFWADQNVSNLTFTDCVVQNSLSDGFGVTDSVHDVNYSRCVAFNNGYKNSTSAGDGFTSHMTNYNIFIDYCLSYNNTCSGYAMVGTSSGHIYNSIAYSNAGNWTNEGGIDQIRGGIALNLEDVNPITGLGWDVKNFIGEKNYPREIRLFSQDNPSNFSYNIYNPINNSKFVSMDSGAFVDYSWENYSSRENYSFNSATTFLNVSSNFSLNYLSPAIDSGFQSNLTTDFIGNPIYGTPDIGAYEYQPPYNISTDSINTGLTKNIRIYGDGKYRHVNSSSSSVVANIKVSPVGGFNSTNYSQLMDINISDWSSSSLNWSESSNNLGNTVMTHTLCGLTSGNQWDIYYTKSGIKSLISKYSVDDSGCIIFNYTAGYSQVIFEAQIYTAPTTETSSSPGATSKPSTASLTEGYSRNFVKNQKVEITINGEKEIITINKILENEVQFSVSGNNYSVSVNSTKKFDLNSDGVYDLQISVNKIYTNGIAQMEFKLINEKIPTKEKESAEEQTQNETPTESKNIHWIILISVFVAAIIFVLIKLLSAKKFEKKYGRKW